MYRAIEIPIPNGDSLMNANAASEYLRMPLNTLRQYAYKRLPVLNPFPRAEKTPWLTYMGMSRKEVVAAGYALQAGGPDAYWLKSKINRWARREQYRKTIRLSRREYLRQLRLELAARRKDAK